MDHAPLSCGTVYKTAEAAEIARCSVRSVQRAIAKGDLVATRLGGLVRITQADLDAWVIGGRAAVPAPSEARPPSPPPARSAKAVPIGRHGKRPHLIDIT